LRCSEEYGVLKPSPEPLLSVADEWNIKAQNMVMVGDRDDMDGRCAREAGMKFIGISVKNTVAKNFYSWNDALKLLRAATDVESV
jgi:phosphoglycolate phosphatase/putative hydrolase of the HAD superfamily